KILRPRLPAKPMNIRICIRGWLRRPVMRVLMKLLTGLKPWQKPKDPTPDVFKRPSIHLIP
ncbi:uncharacterized protein METZ01_LOCUS430231, partial [marine metagenome]